MALGFDLEHGPAIFFIEESDALDQPGKAFGERRTLCFVRHRQEAGASGGT